MIPIFIKVHEVLENSIETRLVRVNVNEIRAISGPTRYSWCDTIEPPLGARALIDFGSDDMFTKESPAQIDNLIEKATISRFKKLDEVV